MAPPRQGPPAPGRNQAGPFPPQKKTAVAPPPPPPPPPPKSTGTGSERSYFNGFIKSHQALKPYAGLIWTWANNYGGITPTELAAVIWKESGGNPSVTSRVGASGLAQILDTAAPETNEAGVPFFRPDRNISASDKTNPAFAIQYAAWRLSGAIQNRGSLDAAYTGNYNPGYTGKGPSALLPKGYIGTPSQTSGQTATRGVGTTAVRKSITDPYVTFKNGKIVPVSDPGKALTYFGQPLTKSTFMQQWVDLNQHFVAYTGKPATAAQVAAFIAKPVSVYQLQIRLAGSPAFVNSPIYKQSAPNFAATWHAIYGEGSTPDKKAIIAAAAKGLDQTAFADQLRQRTDYTKSEEFKQNSSQMSSVFTKIYGVADDQAQKTIDAVTRQGWSPDQFANWLRQQPQYTGSEEYKSKALAFATQLGLLTGDRPTLTAQQAQLGEAPPAPFPPPQTQTAGAATAKPKSPPIQGEAKNEPPFTRKVA